MAPGSWNWHIGCLVRTYVRTPYARKYYASTAETETIQPLGAFHCVCGPRPVCLRQPAIRQISLALGVVMVMLFSMCLQVSAPRAQSASVSHFLQVIIMINMVSPESNLHLI